MKVTLGAKETKAFPFILSWRFPHRHAWSCAFNYIYPTAFAAENDVGNYYTTVYPTALAAAGINISMVNQGASEYSFMIGIKRSDRDVAVRALYGAFFGS